MDSNKAKNKIAKLCSTKEVCRFEAQEKLQKWGLFYNDTEDILNWLEENKFIDDSRYAEFFVRDKYRFNKWGRIKIAYHLRHKQIKEAYIQEAFNEINEEEYRDILMHILKQKSSSLKDDDFMSRKSKLFRHAQSKGYESDLIFSLIDKLLKPE